MEPNYNHNWTPQWCCWVEVKVRCSSRQSDASTSKTYVKILVCSYSQRKRETTIRSRTALASDWLGEWTSKPGHQHCFVKRKKKDSKQLCHFYYHHHHTTANASSPFSFPLLISSSPFSTIILLNQVYAYSLLLLKAVHVYLRYMW